MTAQLGVSLIFIVTQLVRLAPLLSGVTVNRDVLLIVLWALVPLWVWSLTPGFMLALFMQTGAMAQNGEFTAIYSTGISPRRAMRWPLILGIVLFILHVPVSLVIAPMAQQRIANSLKSLLAEAIPKALESGTFSYPVEGLVFFADGRMGRGHFAGVYLEFQQGLQRRVLVSESAQIDVLVQDEVLRFDMFNGELFDISNPLVTLSFEQLTVRLPVHSAVQSSMGLFHSFTAVSTGGLYQSVHSGTASPGETFVFFDRLLSAPVFLLTIIMSAFLAFSVPWKHRYVAAVIAVFIFFMLYFAARVAQVSMASGMMGPIVAAGLPMMLILCFVVLWFVIGLFATRFKKRFY
ncbi:MAG: LptF/LptG family permease [Deltaproteobacteria bacterium]|nr:LptF/LptG family permease [Deltaproteobacteria bacterium]